MAAVPGFVVNVRLSSRRSLSRTVHFKKNVLDKVRGRDKAWVEGRLDDIFLAPDKDTGFARLQQLVADLADRYPGLADFLEAQGEDTLACLNFPSQHRRRIRTTNGLERYNQEIKRRTSPAAAGFPNRNAALRLIGALCMEQATRRRLPVRSISCEDAEAEEWLTGRQYLDMSLLEEADHGQEAELRLETA